jgi:hypothetical protein
VTIRSALQSNDYPAADRAAQQLSLARVPPLTRASVPVHGEYLEWPQGPAGPAWVTKVSMLFMTVAAIRMA